MYSLFEDVVPATPAPAPTQGINTPSGAPTGGLETLAALANVIRSRESSGNPNALSPQGASGSMQIMPRTFQEYARPGEQYNNDEHRTNAALRKLYADYNRYGGDLAKTAAAYIGGAGAIRADGSIRDDVKDAWGTTPLAYSRQVLARMQPVQQTAQPAQEQAAAPQVGADVGIASDGRIYVNGQVFASQDYGRAIELARAGAFSAPGKGTLPPGFTPPGQGQLEMYFESIVPKGQLGRTGQMAANNWRAGWNELFGVGQQILGVPNDKNTGKLRAAELGRYTGQLGAISGEYGVPQNIDEIKGLGGGAMFAADKMVQSLPIMAEMVATGFVGSLLKQAAVRGAATTAEMLTSQAYQVARAKGLAPEAAELVAKEASLGIAKRYAPQLGVYFGGMPSSAADIAQNMRESSPTGDYDIGALAALTPVYAAGNLIGGGAQAVNLLAGRGVRGAGLGAAMPGWTGRGVRGVGGALATAAEEGLAEGYIQEPMNQLGRMAVNPNEGFATLEALKRYRDSAIGGALVGTLTGGGLGAMTSARPAPVTPSTQADLLNPPDIAPRDSYVRSNAPAGTLDPFSRTLGAQSGITGQQPEFIMPHGRFVVGDQAEIAAGPTTGEVASPENQVVGRPAVGTSSITGTPGFSFNTTRPNASFRNQGSQQVDVAGGALDSGVTSMTQALEGASVPRQITADPRAAQSRATINQVVLGEPSADTSSLTGARNDISFLTPKKDAKNPPRGKGPGSRSQVIGEDATDVSITPVKSTTPQETLGEPGRNVSRVTRGQALKERAAKLTKGTVEGGETLDIAKPRIKLKVEPKETTEAVAEPLDAPTDEDLSPEAIKEMQDLIALASTTRKHKVPAKATASARSKTTDAKSKEISDQLDNAEISEHLNRYDTLSRSILGVTDKGSKAKEHEGKPRTRVPRIPSAAATTEASARSRALALTKIVDHLESISDKYGTAQVDAAFAYRKAQGLEKDTNPEDASDAAKHTAANIRLSNLWRMYRDGHLNESAFGFTRSKRNADAGGRSRLEEGGALENLKAWFNGDKKMLKGKYRGQHDAPSGLAGLAYKLRHYPRNDLEGLLGGALYHIFAKESSRSDAIGFWTLPGTTVEANPGEGSSGLFVLASKANPVVVKSNLGNQKTLTAPTLVLSESGAIEETLPHELVHAATWRVISTDEKARTRFTPIIKAINQHLDANGPPQSDAVNTILAAINQNNESAAVAELVAYGFTNTEFQDFLKTIDMKPPAGWGRVAANLKDGFHYFVNMVKLVIGAHGVKYNAMQRFIEEGARLFEQAEASQLVGGKATTLAHAATGAHPETYVPFANLAKPGNFIESAYRKTFETLLPGLYGKGVGDKGKMEEWFDKNATKFSDWLISNHPKTAHVVAGFVDKFGVPHSGKMLLDMARRLAHNASHQSMTMWDSLKGLSPEDQKLVRDFIQSGGRADISRLDKDQRATVTALESTFKDVMSRAVDAKVLPEALRDAPLTELVQWIQKDTASLAYGLKTGKSLDEKLKAAGDVAASTRKNLVIGGGAQFRQGTVTTKDSNGKSTTYKVYVSTAMSDADANTTHGQTIDFDPSGRVYRKLSEGKHHVTMWTPYTYAEGMALMRNTSFIDALAYSMHHILHDTAVHEIAQSWLGAEELNSPTGLVHESKEKLKASGIEDYRVIDGESRDPQKQKFARTPGYWTKLGSGYGDLSGKYVPGPVYAAITDMHEQSALFRDFDQLMSFWKTAKTGWNPVTHFNNVGSSFMAAYLNDIPVATVKDAFRMSWNATFGKEHITPEQQALWNEIEHAGAFVSSHTSHELSKTIYNALNKAVLEKHSPNSASGLMSFLQAWEKSKPAVITELGKKGLDAAKLLYEFEDNVFRAAGYMEFVRREMAKPEGMRGDAMKHEAGRFAANSMVNYSIDARYINGLRRTVLPFIAWPYRMAPMLIRSMIFQPWKTATILSVIYGLNALGYAVTGGDEDDERKHLPEHLRGNLWLMPSAPKALRLPGLIDGKPMYINISNFMPLGDFLSEGKQGFLGLPWPAGLMPGGPLLIAAEVLLGFDAFKNKTISDPTATRSEAFGDRMDYMWRAMMPNPVAGAPALLSDRRTSKFEDLLREKHGITGSEMAWGLEILNAVGPKVVALDRTEREAQMGIASAAVLREYRAAVSKLARDAGRYKNPEDVSEKQAQLIADMLVKIKEIKGEKE